VVQVFDRKGVFCCNHGFPGSSCSRGLLEQASGATFCASRGGCWVTDTQFLARPATQRACLLDRACWARRRAATSIWQPAPILFLTPFLLAAPRPQARHETHLPAFQNSPRPHPRVFGAHENPRRPGRAERAPRQGPQAFGGLSLTADSTRPPAAGLASVPAMLGRLVHKADFERLLQTKSLMRSAHFAVHHVSGAPSLPPKPARLSSKTNLSTDGAPLEASPVNKSREAAAASGALPAPQGVWMGCVVPKRHARRAVTRTLIKRQVRAALQRQQSAPAGLAPGLWLVRLTAGFPVAQFVSARSARLALATREELDTLLQRCQARRSPQPGGMPVRVAPGTAPGTAP
jgi:ribonuclease P protein component